MADRPNGAGGPEHVWPAPRMSTLPNGSVANVYQSIQTAGPLLDAGVPVVLSIAGSDWYLDYHPSFGDVYKVRPCDPGQLDCVGHPGRARSLLGGSVSQWGEKVRLRTIRCGVRCTRSPLPFSYLSFRTYTRRVSAR